MVRVFGTLLFFVLFHKTALADMATISSIEIGVIGADACSSQDYSLKPIYALNKAFHNSGDRVEIEIKCEGKGWLPSGDFVSHLVTLNLLIKKPLVDGKNRVGEIERQYFYSDSGLTGNAHLFNGISQSIFESSKGSLLLHYLPIDENGYCGKCNKAYIFINSGPKKL